MDSTISKLIDSTTVLALATALLFFLGLVDQSSTLEQLGLPLSFLEASEVTIVRGFSVIFESWLTALVIAVILGWVFVDRLVLKYPIVRASFYGRFRRTKGTQFVVLIGVLVAFLWLLAFGALESGRQYANGWLDNPRRVAVAKLEKGDEVSGVLFKINGEYVVMLTQGSIGARAIVLPKSNVLSVSIETRLHTSLSAERR